MTKQELRERMKAYRSALSSHDRDWRSIQMAIKLIQMMEPYNDILCYVSTDTEIDTRYFLSMLFEKEKKQVYVPKCVKGTNEMLFYPIYSFKDLVKGSYSIDEPREGIKPQTEFYDRCCCIVPALCYDRHGYRVGYGKGYYDRFLEDFCGTKIGLCYSDCVVKYIEHDEYDIKADIIVTENSICNIQTKGR